MKKKINKQTNKQGKRDWDIFELSHPGHLTHIKYRYNMDIYSSNTDT